MTAVSTLINIPQVPFLDQRGYPSLPWQLWLLSPHTVSLKSNLLDVDTFNTNTLVATGGSINNVTVGAITPATGAFTTLSSNSTTTLGATSATSLNSTPIGNLTPSTGVFTTLTSSGTTTLGHTTATDINNTPIGNTTPSSGVFTTFIANSTVTLKNYTGFIYANASSPITTYLGTGTGNVVLSNSPTVSGNWGTIDSLKFNLTPTVTPAQGMLYWDGQATLNLQLDAATPCALGEDSFIYVKASSAITAGQLVYFTGAVGASSTITVAPAPSGLTNPDYIVGIAAESIALNGFGFIQVLGSLKGIDTTGTPYGETWATGDVLYYNPVNGGLTHTYPTSGIIVTVAAVTNAGAGGSGSLLIRVTKTQKIFAGTNISVSETSVGTTVSLATSVTGINLDNSPIGNTTPSSGKFTTLNATGGISGGSI